MKRWMVETRVTVDRTYFVVAETEADAEALVCKGDISADLDEETDEVTTNVSEVETEASPCPRDTKND